MEFAVGESASDAVRRQLDKILSVEKNIGKPGSIDDGYNSLDNGESIEEIVGEKSETHQENDSSSNIEKQKNNIPELEDGQVLISTPTCGIICKPKEIRVENKFFVLILDKNDSKNFILIPGTRLQLSFLDINRETRKNSIFFSGIQFLYNNDVFIIFHEVDK